MSTLTNKDKSRFPTAFELVKTCDICGHREYFDYINLNTVIVGAERHDRTGADSKARGPVAQFNEDKEQ